MPAFTSAATNMQNSRSPRKLIERTNSSRPNSTARGGPPLLSSGDGPSPQRRPSPATRGLRGARRSGAYPRRRSLAVDARNSRNSGKSTTAPRCACPDKCGSPACRWRHCRIPQERTDSRSDRVFCFPACGRLLGIGRAASTARLRTCALSPMRSRARRPSSDRSDRPPSTERECVQPVTVVGTAGSSPGALF